MRTTLAASVVCLLALSGCDNGAAPSAQDGGVDATPGDIADVAPAVDAGPRAYPMPEAANAVGMASPRWEGQWRYLYETWGLEQLDEWPPTEFMRGLMTSEPEVFGDQYARFGFVRDAHDAFPIGFKPGTADPLRMHGTCALCHTAQLSDGRLWFGAPNTRLDLGRFKIEVNRRWVAAGHPSLDAPAETARNMALGPGRIGAQTGDNPLDPDNTPSIYTLGARTRLSQLGTGRDVRSEVYLSLFGFGAGYPDDRRARIPFPEEDALDAFIGFFATFEAPPAAGGDAAMLARGHEVFASARCDSCHHVGQAAMDGVVTLDRTPGARERLPGEDPMFPRGTVRTDGFHRGDIDRATTDGGVADGATGSDASADGPMDFGDGYVDFALFILRRHLSVESTDGYRASDLRGLAHSAPYLHNGSVPTLEDMLRPAAMRPRTFALEGFTVDTAAQGNGNGGHEFGTDLSEADRAALVAYLRSL